MVYDSGGRSHSSPGFSYSGNNYHREPTPEEKEQERVKKEQRAQQQQLEDTALQSTLEKSNNAEKLVTGRIADEQQVWEEFLHLTSDKYGAKVASRIANNTFDGKVSIGDLVKKEVPKDIAVEIYQDWDSLWQESVNNVAQSDEAKINQVFQAGIPTAIVGTYGTTLGTKVIWRAFGAVIASKYGVVAAQALGLSAADGLLPVGEAIAFGLLAATAIEIYRNWDKLWAEAEKILVQQEPEAQIYTTPTGEQVETPRTTGHTPPEVETGTPGYDTSQQIETPRHTGHEREQVNASDYIMEASTDKPWRGDFVLKDGNLRRGWRHIDARHITGDHPSGAGDLFEPNTTRAEIEALAKEVVKNGTRTSEPDATVQTFDYKTKFQGKREWFKAVVDTASEELVTIFPMRQ